MDDPVTTTYFEWAALKPLSAVDVDALRSHQHEIGGAGGLHRHLVQSGRMMSDATERSLSVVVLAVGYTSIVERIDDDVTFYDARRRNPDRLPEWRLYYSADGPTEHFLAEFVRPGDLMALAVPHEGPDLVLIVARKDSAWESIIRSLFPTDGDRQGRLLEVGRENLASGERTAPLLTVLEELDLRPSSRPSVLEWVLDQPECEAGFDGLNSFPSTVEMADLAIRWLDGADAGSAVDDRLMMRLDAETELFYAIEAAIALPLLEACSETEEYITLAKSLTQRRAARRGRSFEIHLEHLFAEVGLTFESQVAPPDGERLDFLFPGLAEYLDDEMDQDAVFAANAKTTVRERWRQLAGEALRLDHKWLLTLDPNLSEAVVTAMVEAGVTPVIAEPVRARYGPSIRSASVSFLTFAEMIARTQGGVGTPRW